MLTAAAMKQLSFQSTPTRAEQIGIFAVKANSRLHTRWRRKLSVVDNAGDTLGATYCPKGLIPATEWTCNY